MKIDEKRTPDWYTADEQAKDAKKLRSEIRRMIVRDDRKILLGGRWIIADGALVKKALGCSLIVCGGTLTEMCGGTLTEMRGGTLTTMCGGTLTEMRGGTLTTMRGGTLTEMRGGTLLLAGKYGKIRSVSTAAKIIRDERVCEVALKP